MPSAYLVLRKFELQMITSNWSSSQTDVVLLLRTAALVYKHVRYANYSIR